MRLRRITWSPLTFAPILAIGALAQAVDGNPIAILYAALSVLSLAVWLLVPAKERM